MENIKIEVKGQNYIVVVAETARWGKNEVMFEGNTFNQCFKYIKRELGMEETAELHLNSYLIYEDYTDREGRTFPVEMWVM